MDYGRVAGGDRVLPLPLVVNLVIFGFRWEKNREGLVRRSAYAATANHPKASSRSSQKINDGK